jgi:hypothetical protein
MNAIILKGAALHQPPLPQSGPRAKTIAHPWFRVIVFLVRKKILFVLKPGIIKLAPEYSGTQLIYD